MTGCRYKSPGNSPETGGVRRLSYTFHRQQLIDSTSTLLFVTGFAVGPKGFMYAIDIGDFKLKKFSPDGRLVRETGREGKGPGEFVKSAYTIRMLNGRLALFNTNSPSVELFTPELEFTRSILTNGLIANIAGNGKGDIAVANFFSGARRAVQLIDSGGMVAGNIHGTLMPEPGRHPLFYIVRFLEFSDDNSLYAAYPFVNRVQLLSAGGGELRSFQLPGLPEYSEKRENGLPTNPIIQDITMGPDSTLWVLARGFADNPARDVYVFDRESRYLHTFALPQKAQQLQYRGGLLFTLGNGGREIISWKFEMEREGR